MSVHGRWSKIALVALVALLAVSVATGAAGLSSAGASPVAPMPLPPPRPATEAPPIPPAERGGLPAPAGSCGERIARLGLRVAPVAPIREGPCAVGRPLDVEPMGGDVRLVPKATTVCEVAEALEHWLEDSVAPTAQVELGRTLATVLIGESYSCRGQNRVSGAKLSEHAFGNAVDVMGFGFRTGASVLITARDEGTPEGRFQAAVRHAACTAFTTVLGPGSDPSHANHLHLDLRARKGRYRICQ